MAKEPVSVEECCRRRKEVAGYMSELAASVNLQVEQFCLMRQKALSILCDLRERTAISWKLIDQSYYAIEKIRKITHTHRERERERERI
jgi:hypothetical protein